MLESWVAQSKAVEQFWVPRDEEILGEVPDVVLHLKLKSYLARGALVEQEIFGRMEQARASFLKLQEDLKASDSQKSADIDKVKHELHEQNKRIMFLLEEVSQGRQEADHAIEQAESDRHSAQRLKVELEEERLAHKKL
ncbi:uncharacterized protein A4U43_C05F7090 [Asparagus officinalis]|uniref:Uncharacterized protein n=1 Tax=Asparagus officinalis TaxID=4686 RepID=A0A5P1ETL7_ASPOF|nr:uncharacterized protein A4U43_C05F7090 [Asparagus officinalis]